MSIETQPIAGPSTASPTRDPRLRRAAASRAPAPPEPQAERSPSQASTATLEPQSKRTTPKKQSSAVYLLPNGMPAIGVAPPPPVHNPVELALLSARILGGEANGEQEWSRTGRKAGEEESGKKLLLVLYADRLRVLYTTRGAVGLDVVSEVWLPPSCINKLELIIEPLADGAEGSAAKFVLDCAMGEDLTQTRVLEFEIDTHTECGYDSCDLEIAKGRIAWWRDLYRWDHEPMIPKRIGLAIPPPGVSLVTLPPVPKNYDPNKPETFAEPFPPISQEAQDAAWANLIVQPLSEPVPKRKQKQSAAAVHQGAPSAQAEEAAPVSPARGKRKRAASTKKSNEFEMIILSDDDDDNDRGPSDRPRRSAHDRRLNYAEKGMDDLNDYAALSQPTASAPLSKKLNKKAANAAAEQPPPAGVAAASTSAAVPSEPAQPPRAVTPSHDDGSDDEGPGSPYKKLRGPNAFGGKRAWKDKQRERRSSIDQQQQSQRQQPTQTLPAAASTSTAPAQTIPTELHESRIRAKDGEIEFAKAMLAFSQERNDKLTLELNVALLGSEEGGKWKKWYEEERQKHKRTQDEFDALKHRKAAEAAANADEKETMRKTERELRLRIASHEIDRAKETAAQLANSIDAEVDADRKFELQQQRRAVAENLNAIVDEAKKLGWMPQH